MRFFYFDNITQSPTIDTDAVLCDDAARYTQVFDAENEFYIETWRDKSGRREMKCASFQKPNTEFAKMNRDELARKHNFKPAHLIALDIPTKEFDRIIKEFDIIPIEI